MRLEPKDRKKLVDAAAGRIPCDLVIKDANMVNVFTGEVYPADVGIYDGFIAHIHCDPDRLHREETELVGHEYYDAKGAFLTPGFIDAHIHIESTMMTPRYFAKAVVPHGTTTVITDPHEIGNVLGVEGVKYMHECSEELPMRQFILAPSCVPSLPGKESGGAVFGVNEISELLQLKRVIGLAEVMDYYGVINNAQRMVDLVGFCLDHEKFVQGHAFCIYGRELSAYACGGPMSDHESICGTDASDRIRIGINVDARESSISQDIVDIVKKTKDFRYKDNMTFATDDTESDDILKRGHENYIAHLAIETGLDPIDAVRIGTINAAREAGIKNLGAIAPGYKADLLIIDDLKKMEPRAVFFEGKLVAESGKLISEVADLHYPVESMNTVIVRVLKADQLKIKAPIKEGKITCNTIIFDHTRGFLTCFGKEEVNVRNGFVDISGDEHLKYAAVINRFGKNTIGLAIVRDYGIRSGAVGSTVAHDCHNIIVIYDTPENALKAIARLKETGGGYVCISNGEILAEIKLPVAGLMSNTPINIIAAQSQAFKTALVKMGMVGIAFPMFIMAILPLPVVPSARLTDQGMINAITQEEIPIFDN
jgi:adenine deaminase